MKMHFHPPAICPLRCWSGPGGWYGEPQGSVVKNRPSCNSIKLHDTHFSRVHAVSGTLWALSRQKSTIFVSNIGPDTDRLAIVQILKLRLLWESQSSPWIVKGMHRLRSVSSAKACQGYPQIKLPLYFWVINYPQNLVDWKVLENKRPKKKLRVQDSLSPAQDRVIPKPTCVLIRVPNLINGLNIHIHDTD